MTPTVQVALAAALLAGCTASPTTYDPTAHCPTADGPAVVAVGSVSNRWPPIAFLRPPALDPPPRHDPAAVVDVDDPVAVATRQVADGLAAEGLDPLELDVAVTEHPDGQVHVTVVATHTAGIGHPHQGRYLLVLEPAATGWSTVVFDEAD